MLSKKVTYAIILLNELADAVPNKWGRRVLDKATFLNIEGMEQPLLKQILQQLHASKVITYMNPKNIILNSDLHKVTLYDLYHLFHGGIPVGEEYEQDFHRLDYYSDPKYPNIVLLEMDLKQEASAFFRRYTVASLANTTEVKQIKQYMLNEPNQ